MATADTMNKLLELLASGEISPSCKSATPSWWHGSSWRARREIETTSSGGNRMDDTDFEGTLVLEQLAAVDLVEDFFDAIDADDVERASVLMRTAKIDASTIAIVIRKIEAGGGDH
jgi:hypothetical protein